jgi:exonuclease SbcD
MNILHLADIHLGVSIGPMDPETRLNGRVLDYLDALDAALDFAERNDVDIIIVAGDCFHRPNPDPTYLIEFGERVVRMGELAPTIIIAGNHDIPGSIEKASSVDIFEALEVPGIIIGWQYEVHEIDTNEGMVQVATAPWPRRSEFLSYKEMRNRDEAGRIYKERIAEQILSLESQIDHDYPAILVGHFTVTGSLYGSELMLALDDAAEVDLETMSDAWDYVALGHIHTHQDVNFGNNPPVVYSGSLERVDFGDENDNKGFVWCRIDDDGVNYEFIEIDARPYITIRANVVGKTDPMRLVLGKIRKLDVNGAIVRVIINISDHNVSAIHTEAIHRQLIQEGVYCVQGITFDLERTFTARLDLDKPIHGYDELELLEIYFGEQSVKSENLDILLDIAEDIMDEVDEEISSS